jgi:hypothetical protein
LIVSFGGLCKNWIASDRSATIRPINKEKRLRPNYPLPMSIDVYFCELSEFLISIFGISSSTESSDESGERNELDFRPEIVDPPGGSGP